MFLCTYLYFYVSFLVVSPVETPFHNLHEVFNCFSSPAVTPHPMEAEIAPGPSLVESFKMAFDDSETADIKFLVEGREINAHRGDIFFLLYLTVLKTNSLNILILSSSVKNTMSAFSLNVSGLNFKSRTVTKDRNHIESALVLCPLKIPL